VPNILADIYWAGFRLPEILIILFTQSTAVLHKYLNDELKYFVCYNFSLRLQRIPREFPEFSMFREIPGFPGLWPPWLHYKGIQPVKSLATTVFLAHHCSMVAACCPQSGTLTSFSALVLWLGDGKGTVHVKVLPKQFPRVYFLLLGTGLTWINLTWSNNG